MAQLVHGEIHLPAGAEISSATLYLTIENVALLDGPAPVVASKVLPGVRSSGGPIPFSIDGTVPDSGYAEYSLRAHLSLHNGQDVNKGDYITTRRYNVLADGLGQHIALTLEQV